MLRSVGSILEKNYGFKETYDFTWVKDNYICARWFMSDKLFVYKKIEGGVWKLSYFLPYKDDDIEDFKRICDELITNIQRERKFSRILFSE